MIRELLRHFIDINTRFRVRYRLLEMPLTSGILTAIDQPLRACRIRKDTELVIDGFPRSANTYARVAFEHANGRGHSLSSHMHSPRIVLRAVRNGVPCIVLIRHPVDAAASLMQWLPGLRAETALNYYSRYYQHLRRIRSKVVIASFDEVVGDFGRVIDRCNSRFGTRFLPYVPNAQNEMSVREDIHQIARNRVGHEPNWPVIARPDVERRQRSADLLSHLDESTAPALEDAMSTWEWFSSLPDTKTRVSFPAKNHPTVRPG